MAPRQAAVMPRITIPRGRSEAEKRLGAIAALHQPMPDRYRIFDTPICRECGNSAWPCATARLMGTWPGDNTSDDT